MKKRPRSITPHTPAPWEFRPVAFGHFVLHGAKPVGPACVIIPTGEETRVKVITGSDPVDEANARLIAASPDLLLACREMVGAAEYCVDLMHAAGNPQGVDPVDWKGVALHMYASLNVMAGARKAISKATGTA